MREGKGNRDTNERVCRNSEQEKRKKSTKRVKKAKKKRVHWPHYAPEGRINFEIVKKNVRKRRRRSAAKKEKVQRKESMRHKTRENAKARG